MVHDSAGSPFRPVCVALLVFLAALSSLAAQSDEAVAQPLADFPYRQELPMPIDTSQPGAAFQPIDLRISFDHACWALNETMHSIRVAVETSGVLTEIESQIYDLSFMDGTHIEVCSLVFIIPGWVTGSERYLVLYDDQETAPPRYPDHVGVEEASYYYEPVPGQRIDFDYYKVMQGGDVAYGVIQQGELLGNGISQVVVKMKPGSPVYETNYADQMASFSLFYSIDGDQERTGTGYAEEVAKAVLVDGNLMVRVRLAGADPDETVYSDHVYTYYYSPSEATALQNRMSVNIHQQVLQSVEIGGSMEEDGMYAGILSFRVRSQSFDKLNTGRILPYIHMPDENGVIRAYEMPLNPTSSEHDWVLRTRDDADIGTDGWVSLDDPATGKAHGLVFQTATGLLDGSEDGLQVKASGQQYVNVPGLEADAGQVIVNRNAYEQGGQHNTRLPETLDVQTNVAFFTSETGGYEAVAREADLFRQLVVTRPYERGIVDTDTAKTYNLTVAAHLAPSFPLGAPLSAVLGQNVSYIGAELYQNETLVSSGSASRIKLIETTGLSLDGLSLLEQLRLIGGLLDFRNSSLFKTIVFPGVPDGDYLVKLYRENTLSGSRRYIGFAPVLIDGADTTIRVVARPEMQRSYQFTDQHGHGVAGIELRLMADDIAVTSTLSNQSGHAWLAAPHIPSSPYQLFVFYDGFLLDDTAIDRPWRRTMPLQAFGMELYSLSLQLTDTWGLPLAVDVAPLLKSDYMTIPTTLTAMQEDPGIYRFTGLYPATYTLSMRYKLFTVQKQLTIDGDEQRSIQFPAEFEVHIDARNAQGLSLGTADGMITRENESHGFSLSEGKTTVTAPPGAYMLELSRAGDMIAREIVHVREEQELLVITHHESLLHQAAMYLGGAICIAGLLIIVWRRQLLPGLSIAIVGLIALAVATPWWRLTGSQGEASTQTVTLLFPPKIMTTTHSSSFLGGEVSQLPGEFTLALTALSYVVIAVLVILCIGIIVRQLFRRRHLVLDGIPLVALTVVLLGFIYAMSVVTDVGVGSFIGSGTIESAARGFKQDGTMQASWGPGIGLYVAAVAAVLLGAVMLHQWRDLFHALLVRMRGWLSVI
ncbi:MAG: hypothetical protein ACP5FL_07520, partial [Thermoplasmatota archaeon]